MDAPTEENPKKRLYVTGGTTFAIDKHRLVTANHICTVVEERENTHLVLTRHNGYRLLDYKGNIVVIRQEAKSDLCMLWIEDTVLCPLKVSKHYPRMGDKVFIYGSPAGEFGYLTTGFIARTHKRIQVRFRSGARSMTVMSFSAPAWGGNSGSPIINEDGEVIGMLSSGSYRYPFMNNSPTYHDFINFVRQRD
jgi:S1-C subfamily serine protease